MILDSLLEEAYWSLRVLSVIEVTETHEALFKDAYMLLSNIETYYTYEAAGFFKSDYDMKLYFKNYICPLLYTLRVVRKLQIKTMPTRPISNFLWVYSQGIPGIQVVRSMCVEAGVTPPTNLNYRVSREWLTYPKSIKRLGKGILLQDLRFKEKK